MSESSATSVPETGAQLLRRGLALEYATLSWNVVGSVVVLLAALAARSVALAGFGLDSLIEILASLVVVWHLKGAGAGRERPALRIIGVAFIMLAVYILGQSAYTFATMTKPDKSMLGIAWLFVTFLAMLALAWGKARTGRALNNPVLTTEGKVTLVDAYLAGTVLLGLCLNWVASWWWADPAASLIIVVYGIKEGVAALREASS